MNSIQSFKPIYSSYDQQRLDKNFEAPIKDLNDDRIQEVIDHYIKGEEGARFTAEDLGPGWSPFKLGGHSCETGQRLTISAANNTVTLVATFAMFGGKIATRSMNTLQVNSGEVRTESVILECEGKKSIAHPDREMSIPRPV